MLVILMLSSKFSQERKKNDPQCNSICGRLKSRHISVMHDLHVSSFFLVEFYDFLESVQEFSTISVGEKSIATRMR